MITITLRATYTEQVALETFFTRIFGRGQSAVLVRTSEDGVMPCSKLTLVSPFSGGVEDSNALSPEDLVR